ncbi:major capsid protein [Microviridae sp.]|nr:major capsid protein [Microviridae sp.]
MNPFKNVFMPNVGKNRFDLSHDVKLSFNMGDLVPTMVMDVLPGDSITMSAEKLLRFQPLIAPVMHRVDVTSHFFFVPNRILWDNWENFITGNEDVEAPYIRVGGTEFGQLTIPEGSLGDYMGLPTGESEDLYNVNALPFAAYTKIWDEYYRDQNLQDEQFRPLLDGNNGANNYLNLAKSTPLHRAWNHDYFTSALPFAQKGDEVTLPLADQAFDVELKTDFPLDVVTAKRAIDGTPSSSGNMGISSAGGINLSGQNLVLDPEGSLEVDLSSGESLTINALRRLHRLQEWLEKNARGGTRYIEQIKAHFGVSSSDKRLNRPEYIGGSKGRMSISEVLTSVAGIGEQPNTVDPAGTMKGHGVSVSGGNTFRYNAEEHGWIIGIINVQPKTAYQQGLHRMYSRFDKLDYAFPTFANIGEQAILNKELYIDLPEDEQNEVFGYIPRYSEYRYMNNRVAGDFKSTLDYWHFGRIFGNKPTLNDAFVECDPPERPFAVLNEDDHKILAHVYNNVSAVRKLPKFAIPTI